MGLAFMTMAACSENTSDEPAMSGNIQLGVAVGNLQSNSRANADPFLLQNGKPLKAAVWFRNDGGSYEHNPAANTTTHLPVHTTVEFNGTQPTYVMYQKEPDKYENIKYPTDNTPVYCIGMYPDTDWTTTDNTNISHAIDGNADLMFAKEIRGSWNDNFTKQTYEHLLTWIKIDICATSHDAVDAWGTIKQITINSASEVSVDSQTGQYTYSGVQEINTIDNDGKPLSTTINEVGSVFCSPKKEYTLKVTTVNKSNVEETRVFTLPLNTLENEELNEDSEARGKCFVYSLYFTPDSVIEGSCALNSWNNQNEDIYID